MDSVIPTDKFDVAAVERAGALGWPAIEPFVAALLAWIQDMNWPVAPQIVKVLAPIGAPLAGHIQPILRGHDPVWKFWLIDRLLGDAPLELTTALQAELEQLVDEPSEAERAEKVDVVARAALQRIR